MSKMNHLFTQESFQLRNQYLDDVFLQRCMREFIPAKVLHEIEGDLTRFGERVVTDVWAMCKEANMNEPTLDQFGHFGRRKDDIVTCNAWKQLRAVSAEEGMVAIAYERAQGEYSRVYQFAKLYLFNPSSAIYTCPLAMTDGAARLLEVHGNERQRREVFARLISRDPARFFTSGQWMTERTGGSDVSRTETQARELPWADGRRFALTGFKWFTSATDADVTVALARIIAPDGSSVPGSRGLSTFLVPVRNIHGELNGITVHRLKDKLGTRAMPTAELELRNAEAELLGERGRGVPTISHILNITRLHNSISAASFMRRAIAIARDYATRRQAFGKPLEQHPLHMRTLAWLEVECRACTVLVLYGGLLMGRTEVGTATPTESQLLRLLTPLTKLFTAKRAMAVVSEALEAMGGAGYIEDGPLPTLLRDTQVLSIWEGTTNILSLDVLRVLGSGPYIQVFCDTVAGMAREYGGRDAGLLSACSDQILQAVEQLQALTAKLLQAGPLLLEASARFFAFSLARTFCAALLLRLAAHSRQPDDRTCVQRWCNYGLVSVPLPADTFRAEDRALVYARL